MRGGQFAVDQGQLDGQQPSGVVSFKVENKVQLVLRVIPMPVCRRDIDEFLNSLVSNRDPFAGLAGVAGGLKKE